MHGSFRTFCWDESGAASADWVLVAAILLLSACTYAVAHQRAAWLQPGHIDRTF